MILKLMNDQTNGWRMFESDVIEIRDAWLGTFPRSNPNDGFHWAVYEVREDNDPTDDPTTPVARRAPLLLDPMKGQLLVSDAIMHGIIDHIDDPVYQRTPIKLAVIVRDDNDDLVVAFGGCPAYLMNDAGKTIEKL